ncbi:MAG TPA: DNA primase catalytic subunit PriS [Candidatus Syntrophoarchaeum butanivorans]|uniref:DNA primase small subunit PriS n=1 Tax=Candidatus Syntropharchaeum butanivorans TaxID=1839936 RepID=A0A7C1B5W6_9EURY|nr:DNA primase catalytic subunit PriS [Candidatus Syntrophoarchaeum butanivorans]
MDERTRAFVKSIFRAYYRREDIKMPLKFDRREWGFMPFEEGRMHRHKAFRTKRDVIEYLRDEVPRHVYYSSAVYTDPSAPKMAEKGWEGAELIFDLDADHLQIKAGSYEEMLDAVKKETIKLLRFLEDDFGFSQDDIEIAFSGGRGYHVHVYHPKVWKLTSPERREIVDYITARGLDLDRIFRPKYSIVGDSGEGGTKDAKLTKIIHTSSWGERIHQGLVEFMEELSEMEEDEAIEYLSGIKGLGKKRAKKLLEVAKDKTQINAIKDGNIIAKKIPTPIWRYIIEGRMRVELGEVDEPVTADIKRLIRLPTSLHGGSSLKVVPLTRDAFNDFDPLVDAVAFDKGEITIDLTREASISLNDENYSFDPGINDVPLAVGLFLICRGMAEFKEIRGNKLIF